MISGAGLLFLDRGPGMARSIVLFFIVLLLHGRRFFPSAFVASLACIPVTSVSLTRRNFRCARLHAGLCGFRHDFFLAVWANHRFALLRRIASESFLAR